MQLSENKTYRTRDGSRTGIRVRNVKDNSSYPWEPVERIAFPERGFTCWSDKGFWYGGGEDIYDLIEEPPAAPQPFSYDACPVGEDGRKRAVTVGGYEFVLLCNDAPGPYPIRGYDSRNGEPEAWTKDGTSEDAHADSSLLVPPPRSGSCG